MIVLFAIVVNLHRICSSCKIPLGAKMSVAYGKCFYCRNKRIITAKNPKTVIKLTGNAVYDRILISLNRKNKVYVRRRLARYQKNSI